MKYDGIVARTDNESIKKYMGKLPPDLSMYIRSRGDDYLHKFINEPQKLLHGTSMPRVGLTKESQAQVVEYMESVGDAKKSEREALGKWVLLYMVILSVLAILWKKKVWKEVQ
jgi:ubiquinol-cytochrome c reductase cytochrome c1 subunit